MQIRFDCPTDGCVAIIQYEPLERSGPTMQCPRCRVDHPITISDSIRSKNMVDRCGVCSGRELFIRKDFPRALGLGIVLAVLASGVVLDFVIYLIVGRVTACYACRAEYRKCSLNPAHEGFDLAVSEKY